MFLNKKSLSILIGFSLLSPTFANASQTWVQAENMLSTTQGLTAITTYHDHIYIAGYDTGSMQPNNCTFVYAYQSFNDWLSVNNGLQPPTTCVLDLHSFVTYHDQLYAGGLSGFFVYNGDDFHPNWTSLSMTGLPAPQSTITNFAVFQNKIYAIATDGSGGHTGVFVYNTTSQTWTDISTLVPVQPRVAGPPTSLIVFNNKLYWLYNFVNTPGGAYHAVMYVYNGNDNEPSWSTVFKAEDNRAFFAMDIFNNTLIVAGDTGMGNSNNLPPSAFILAYNGDDKIPQWNDISGYAGPLNDFQLSTLSHDANALYVGGMRRTNRRSAIYQFNGDFKKPNWTELDNGIKRYIGPGYVSTIGMFANTSLGLFTADFASTGGSVVYQLADIHTSL